MTEKGPQDPDVRLKRLHKTCELTLHRYMAMAADTCSLTGRLRMLPVSRDKRLEVFMQKKKEDEARDAYLKARHGLLSAIEADPDIVTAAGAEASSPVRVHGKPRSGAYRRRSG